MTRTNVDLARNGVPFTDGYLAGMTAVKTFVCRVYHLPWLCSRSVLYVCARGLWLAVWLQLSDAGVRGWCFDEGLPVDAGARWVFRASMDAAIMRLATMVFYLKAVERRSCC